MVEVEFGTDEIALLPVVGVTVAVTAFLLVKHSLNFVRPGLQVCYMRMALLPGVFSVLCYLSFIMPHIGVFIEALRGFIEAYVLYCFFVAMVLYAGGQERVAKLYERRRWLEEFKHSWFCGLLTWRDSDGRRALHWHKRYVQQLMVLKPFFTLISAVAQLLGDVEHNSAVKSFIGLVAVFNLAAMMYLMRTLLIVYQITQPQLAGMGPKLKFGMVKLLVFVLIVQNFVVNMLVAGGSIPERDGLDEEEVATRVQSQLGVFEMLAFAVFFLWTFPANDPSLYIRRGLTKTAPELASDGLVSVPIGTEPEPRVNTKPFSDSDAGPWLEASASQSQSQGLLGTGPLGGCAAVAALVRFHDILLHPLEEVDDDGHGSDGFDSIASPSYLGLVTSPSRVGMLPSDSNVSRVDGHPVGPLPW